MPAQLNFPSYTFRFKSNENKMLIFDVLRKKFVQLTPEEWVRQHCVHYLIEDRKYPKSLLSVERQINLHGVTKRYDIVGFKPDGAIQLVVECKAPGITITQEVFDQIARYNMILNADYLMLTNGKAHYFCRMNYKEGKYEFLREIPLYSSE